MMVDREIRYLRIWFAESLPLRVGTHYDVNVQTTETPTDYPFLVPLDWFTAPAIQLAVALTAVQGDLVTIHPGHRRVAVPRLGNSLTQMFEIVPLQSGKVTIRVTVFDDLTPGLPLLGNLSFEVDIVD